MIQIEELKNNSIKITNESDFKVLINWLPKDGRRKLIEFSIINTGSYIIYDHHFTLDEVAITFQKAE